MRTPSLDLTIIIPNYNTRELVVNCIASIFRFTTGIEFEVIFIDDNSRDGSADAVATAFPQVSSAIRMPFEFRHDIGQQRVR
jgi:glycosyltransferase involved in cell wall biosynthesis